MVRFWPYFVFLIAALVIGCGGGGNNGGGGGSTTGSRLTGTCEPGAPPQQLLYRTNWSGTASTASQILQFLNEDGFAVRTESFNRDGQGESELLITNISPGTYRLSISLFSQPNGGGSLTGELEVVVELCRSSGSLLVHTNASGTVESVDVWPPAVTMQQQQSRQFVATPKAADGRPTFVQPGSINWDVQGGIGTIDSEGLFAAETAGTGSVTATHFISGKSGASAVTIEPFVITRGKWTVIVFLNAANDLFSFSDLNVNQMEAVAQNQDVRFVIQWKQSRDLFSGSSFDGVRRYLVKPDSSVNSTIVSEVVQSNLVDDQGRPLDMGDPETLNEFIDWAKRFYPADRYCLVVWNHGNGWRRTALDEMPTRAFSYDDQTGNSIQTWQTDQALAGQTFDILAWDCSLMQMIEVAYETRTYAEYIVGSEESPPGEGYPYHLIFDDFRDNPDGSTRALTQAFVEGMVNNPPYVNRKITQSSLESALLDELAMALDALADALIVNVAVMGPIVSSARDNAQAYSPTTFRIFRDVVHLCQLIEADSNTPTAVKTACANVRAAVNNAVAWEAHNNNSVNSNGVSIDFSDRSSFQSSRLDYMLLKFAQDTSWDEWLSIAPE